MLIADEPGQTAIDFGVYGAPESFLIDAKGVIRYKHIGPFTPDVVANELKPAIAAHAEGARHEPLRAAARLRCSPGWR